MNGWRKEYTKALGLTWKKAGAWSNTTMAMDPLHGRRTTITTSIGSLDLMWSSCESSRACDENPFDWRSEVLVFGKPDKQGTRLIASVNPTRLRDFLRIVRPVELEADDEEVHAPPDTGTG
jgi:hypothetical protein